MKVTRNRVVTMAGLIVSSLLLILAASCSLDKQAACDTKLKHSQEDTSEHQVAQQQSENKSFVANVFCSACHYGFSDEKLASTHEKASVGCERCHGESERHRSDEDNITPPEIMYPKARINPTCMMCHPRHEIQHVASHKELLAGAKTVFDSSDEGGNQIYCTDCHAPHHRINVRTIRWNKETGELIKK
jgi:hypothetical protein